MSEQAPRAATTNSPDRMLEIEILLRLLPVCGTLAGLCLAGLAFLETVAPQVVANT
jgi:hypothetical protein